MADTIKLVYIKTGPGRTLAYEAGDKDKEDTCDVWQEVEAGDGDGWWDEGVCVRIRPDEEPEETEDGEEPEYEVTMRGEEPIECDCGHVFFEGEDICPECGLKELADYVHPHCQDCDATIYTMHGDWLDPWGDYHCSHCVSADYAEDEEEEAEVEG